jgi:hypothetical protein
MAAWLFTASLQCALRSGFFEGGIKHVTGATKGNKVPPCVNSPAIWFRIRGEFPL